MAAKKIDPVEVKTQTLLPITITIDPEALIERAGSVRVWDEDGEPSWENVDLIHLVADRLAQHYRSDLQKTVLDSVTTVIREQVTAIVESTIRGEVRLTNGYGEATGKVTTLRERIVEEATAKLNSKVSPRDGSYDRYSGRESITFINYVARQVAESALKNELAEAAKAAVADVKKAVTELVSAEIGKKVTQVVTGSR